jgi:serine phosphatase RsbU (regulator of sigma subunit)
MKRAPLSTFLIQQHGDEKRSPAKTDISRVKRLLGPATSNKSYSVGKTAAEELALAALIHSKLMSINLPSASYARLKAKTLPCSAIGGDFFDAIALGDSIYAVVADVSGKGVPAAIVAAMLQGIIHAQMLADQPLQAIADMVNQFLCSRATGKYATMVLLKLWANGVAEYLNCGHVLPVLINGVRTRHLDRSNVVVGLIPTAQYYSDACELLPGDRVLIFTDGITETENARGEQFGDVALGSFAHLGDVDGIFEHVATFQGGVERQDDWTLLELLYQGWESLAANSSRSEGDEFAARCR